MNRRKSYLKAKRKNIASEWSACAEVPEIKRICLKVVGGYDMDPELQAYADKNAIKIRNAFAFLGLKFSVDQTPGGPVQFSKCHRPGGSRQNAVLRACEKLRKPDSITGPQIKAPLAVRAASKAINPRSFYKSDEWAKLRYDALVASNGKCLCCGSSALDGAVLRVDHIRSIRTAPHLKADPTNLQVLCNKCNWGKGGIDSTDWRYGGPSPF